MSKLFGRLQSAQWQYLTTIPTNDRPVKSSDHQSIDRPELSLWTVVSGSIVGRSWIDILNYKKVDCVSILQKPLVSILIQHFYSF